MQTRRSSVVCAGIAGRVGLVVVVLATALAGCGSALDPVRGVWRADGAQPAGYTDFGAYAEIEVDKNDEGSIGTPPYNVCGGLHVTAQKVDHRTVYRMTVGSWCPNTVPNSIDMAVDGDKMTVTATEDPGRPVYHFKKDPHIQP